MPRIYAPKATRVALTTGAVVNLARDEIRVVSAEIYRAAVSQGAVPAPKGFSIEGYKAALNQTDFDDGAEDAAVIDEKEPDDESIDEPTPAELEAEVAAQLKKEPTLDNVIEVDPEEEIPTEELDRYPAPIADAAPAEEKPEAAPAEVVPGSEDLDTALLDAMRRIAKENNPKDFNQDGSPKAFAVKRELGGLSVITEVRLAAWDKVKEEIDT